MSKQHGAHAARIALLLQLVGVLTALLPEQCSYLHPAGMISEPSLFAAAEAADRRAAAAERTGTRFLIAMRSIHIGSSWLSRLLAAHPGVGTTRREWFKAYRCCILPPVGAPRALAKNRYLIGANQTSCFERGQPAAPYWEAQLRGWYESAGRDAEPTAQATSGRAAIGFKNQLPVDLTAPRAPGAVALGANAAAWSRTDAFHSRCGKLREAEVLAQEARFWEILARLRIRVVCLHRANGVARLLSNGLAGKAKRGNASYKVEIDEASVHDEMLREAHFRRMCERGARVVPTYWLGYEDLYLGDTRAELDGVQRFLGLTPRPPTQAAGSTKRAPKDITTRIANVRALRARGGLVGAMLAPDFGPYNASACGPALRRRERGPGSELETARGVRGLYSPAGGES
jgi:hypothetical protein